VKCTGTPGATSFINRLRKTLSSRSDSNIGL
jgi:hypothetical protein